MMNITNNSKLPISIMDMSLICNRDSLRISAVSRGDGHIVYNSDKPVTSLSYPINIPGFSSVGGYIHFYTETSFTDFEEQDAEISVNTNRGLKKFRLHLGFGDNVYRVIQPNSGEIPMLLDVNGNCYDYHFDAI